MYILLGSPGSGKSTQADLLRQRLGLQVVSTGNLLRRQAHADQLAAMNRGELADTDYVNEILAAELARLADRPEIILDGYPRKPIEADWFLKNYALQIKACLVLELSIQEASERNLKRDRPDDNRASLERRIGIFQANLAEVVDCFARHRVAVLPIPAEGSREAVYQRIELAIQPLKS